MTSSVVAVRVGLLLTLVAGAGASWAGTPQNWSLSTGAQFSTGSLDGTALDADGRVRLAPDVETLWGPEQGIVWSVAASGEELVFVGLSGPGRLLRVGGGADAETWYRADDEGLVTSVAGDGSGGVLFGVTPGGALMHAAAAGEATKLIETGALFVWALVRDAEGIVWIGTGSPGQLLRYERNLVTRIFESGDDPIRTICPLPGGGVVFGTGGRGRVLRYDGKSGPFVLYDADEPEIVGIQARPDGTVFALAASAAKQPSPIGRADPSVQQVDESVRVTASPPDGNAGSAGGGPEASASERQVAQQFRASPGGSLYRIDPSGHARRLWASAREVPFGLVLDREERVLVATGDDGRIVTVDDQGQAGFVMRIPSRQASATGRDARGRVIVGGTTDASVNRLGAGPREVGSYLTPALDATTTADWGRLSWDAGIPPGTKIEVEVRGGNSSEPDKTWTRWVAVADGKARSAVVELPATRWFQARFTMHASRGAESPSLGRVELVYLPHNRPPSIGSLEIQPPGVAWILLPAQAGSPTGPEVADDPIAARISRSLRQQSRNQPVRKTYESGARTISWLADDADGDELRYDVAIRGEGSAVWLPLVRDLRVPFYGWDARAMPDGYYRVRLTVSDAAANPMEQSRTAELVSEAFHIDNSRPVLDTPRIAALDGAYEVRFAARDEGGAIAAAELQFDDGVWRPLSPVDGLPDSELERFEVRVPASVDGTAGVRVLRVRVLDASGNLGGANWALGHPDEAR